MLAKRVHGEVKAFLLSVGRDSIVLILCTCQIFVFSVLLLPCFGDGAYFSTFWEYLKRKLFFSAVPSLCAPLRRPFFCYFFPAGRELSKLAIAWQAAAYGSDPAVFTPDLMVSVTDTFLEQKVGW